MKTRMKGTALAILMSLTVFFAMMPMMAGAAYADSRVTIDNVHYTLHDAGDAAVSGCTSSLPETVTLPDKVNSDGIDYAVTSIDRGAFKETMITSITIPANVRNIGNNAFYNCQNLGTVTFGEGSKLESIGEEAFRNTGITSITIPAGVISIGKEAFRNTGITSITIPASVTGIGDTTFRECSNLGTVTFDEGSKLESIGKEVFRKTGITSITIPANVRNIGNNAFYNCKKLGTVTFDEGSKLESIDNYAFCRAAITSITIPANVRNIGNNAFYYCQNLETVTFDEGSKLESIGMKAFIKTKLTSITIPAGVTSIGETVFSDDSPLDTVYYDGTEAQWDCMSGRDANWAGGRENDIQVICLKIKVVTGDKALTYNGNKQTGVAAGTGYTLSGTVSAVNAGSYTATATLKTDANYVLKWDDGTTDPKAITWKIDKAVAKVSPPAGKTFTYDGKEKTGVAGGSSYTLSGAVKATNAGTYTAKAGLKTNANYAYKWTDGTTAARSIPWKINKAAVKVSPPAGKTFTYDGKEKAGVTPGSNYTLSGTVKATNAGTYTAKAVLKTNANYAYTWTDGTTAARSITWKINKANNPLTVKAKKATVKYRKLKKQNRSLAVTRVIGFTKTGQGKMNYKLVSAKKGKKSFKKYFRINKKTGKVTIRKNTKMKKGTYKVKVKVKAAGNVNYKASAWKAVTFIIKVK